MDLEGKGKDWAHVASNRYRCWAHVHVVMQFYYIHIPDEFSHIPELVNCRTSASIFYCANGKESV